MADVPQAGTWLDNPDAAPHRFVTYRREAAREHRSHADEVHAAGVAVEAVANHGDVDIDDVAAFQALITRNSVAYHMVHRRADSLGKTPVIEIGRDRLQLVDDEI